MGFLASIGRPLCDVVLYLVELVALTGRTAIALADVSQPGHRVVRRTTLMQLYFTGVQGVPVVIFLSALVGIALAAVLPQQELLVRFLVQGYVRELAPLVAGLVILARSTTAITVELGNMTVGRELHLLKTLGIDPDFHVALPRAAGVMFASVGLSILGVAASIFAAAFFLAMTTQSSPILLLSSVVEALSLGDIIALTTKSVLFGGILVTCALREGLELLPLTTEVPKAVSKAVMRALLLLWTTELLLLMANYG